jgi:hypothetical protein
VEHDLLGAELLDQLLDELRLLDGQAADGDPVHPGVEHPLELRFFAEAAGHLELHRDRQSDVDDQSVLPGGAFAGAVNIGDMDPFRAGLLELEHGFHRIAKVARRIATPPRGEAHRAAVHQVHGGVDDHLRPFLA